MQSPLDASTLNPVRQHVFKDAAQGYFIDDIGAIRAEFDGKIQRLNTREMKLETLGIFPLAPGSLPLLEKVLSFSGKKLTIPPLLARSHIPIFSESSATGTASTCAYIPAEGANICRYFYELWENKDDNEADEAETVIQGFALLASYAGL